MPDFAEPYSPFNPKKDTFSRKSAMSPFNQMQEDLQAPVEEAPYDVSYQPTMNDLNQMVQLGVDPREIFGEKPVMDVLPQGQQFDQDQPGYFNDAEEVYDIDGDVVYEGEKSSFVIDPETNEMMPNPSMDPVEFDRNFYFQDGNWKSASSNKNVLPLRDLTTWEGLWRGTVDPFTRTIHQLDISTQRFLDEVTDQNLHAKVDPGDNWTDSFYKFGDGLAEGASALFNPYDKDFMRGAGYGWRTDAAPHQPGWMKALMGLNGADEHALAFQAKQSAMYEGRFDKASAKTFQMNEALFRGMFDDNDAVGLAYKALIKYNPHVRPHVEALMALDILSEKSFGKTLENTVIGTGAILMHMADPAGALDVALSGGFSMVTKARHLGTAGKSLKTLEEYRHILKAYGPEVLIKQMVKNNPDKMNANHWATLFSEVGAKKKSILPFSKIVKDPEAVKNFMSLDLEGTAKILGADGMVRLTEMLPPTMMSNGKAVYDYDDLMNVISKLGNKKMMEALATNMNTTKFKSLQLPMVVSEVQDISNIRKSAQANAESMVAISNIKDDIVKDLGLTHWDGMVSNASAVRQSKGYGNAKYRHKNQFTNETLDDMASIKAITDEADVVASFTDDVIDTPSKLAKQLMDPAVASITGETRLRKTDWVKFKKHVGKYAGKSDDWWNKFFSTPESFQLQLGGKMKGVTTGMIETVKTDMKRLQSLTKDLDTFLKNKPEAEKLLKLYPKLKMPGQFRLPVNVVKLDLAFGPNGNVKELNAKVDFLDSTGKINPSSADSLNLYAQQNKVWTRPKSYHDVIEMSGHVSNLADGVIPGGKFTDQGQVIDELLRHAGKGDSHKAIKIDGEWTVINKEVFESTDQAIETVNQVYKADTFQMRKTEEMMRSGANKIEVSEALTNNAAKRGADDIKSTVDSLLQQEKSPGYVGINPITPERVMQSQSDDLISNWSSVKTPEQDAELLKQIKKNLGSEYVIKEGEDFIAVYWKGKPGTPIARVDAPEDLHGRGLMRTIEDVQKEGGTLKLFSSPIPGLESVSDFAQESFSKANDIARKLRDGVGNKSPKFMKDSYNEIRNIFGELKAKAWFDVKERFGDMAYREMLRMNEIWFRQRLRDESMGKMLNELIVDLDASGNWKKVYQSKRTPDWAKRFMREKTNAGARMSRGLDAMGHSAEGIKTMPASGNPDDIVFGTKTYKTVMEDVPGQKNRVIRDPDDPGTWNIIKIDGKDVELNPENSKALWDKLSPTQKKFVTEYTRDGGTKHAYFDNFQTYNRNTALDFYNVESHREGYMHHSFEWKQKLKGVSLDDEPEVSGFAPLQKERMRGAKKAGPRKFRTGAEGYKQNFLESIKDYTLKMDKEQIMNDAFEGVERNVMMNQAQLDELAISDPVKRSRMEEYKPAFEANKTDEKMYVDSVIHEELTSTAGMSRELGRLNKILRIGKLQLLVHPATWATNAVGGALQMTAYGMNLMTRTMTGDPVAWAKIKTVHKSFLAAATRKMPVEMFGAKSNQVTQFGPGGGMLNNFIDTMLTPMGAIENFYKRFISEMELSGQGKNWEDVITQEGRIKDMDTYFDLRGVTDLYGFDYSNVSQYADYFRQKPFGIMVAPFATYPYKYAKSVAYYADAFNPKSWAKVMDKKYVDEVGQEAATDARRSMVAKFMTATTIIAAAAADGLSRSEKPIASYKEGMDYATDSTGRMNFGMMDSDSYVRYVKYPGLNIYGPIQKMFHNIGTGASLGDSSDAAMDDFYASTNEMFSLGGNVQLIGKFFGQSGKYTQHKSKTQMAVSQLYSHVPFLGMSGRWGQDVNKIIEQEKGYTSKKKRGFVSEFMSRIPGAAWLDEGRLMGDVSRYGKKREHEIKRSLLGINIKKISKEDAQFERERVEALTERREETQAALNVAGEYGTRTKSKRRRKRRRKR